MLDEASIVITLVKIFFGSKSNQESATPNEKQKSSITSFFPHEAEDLLEKKNIIPSKEIRDGDFEDPLDLMSVPAMNI